MAGIGMGLAQVAGPAYPGRATPFAASRHVVLPAGSRRIRLLLPAAPNDYAERGSHAISQGF